MDVEGCGMCGRGVGMVAGCEGCWGGRWGGGGSGGRGGGGGLLLLVVWRVESQGWAGRET